MLVLYPASPFHHQVSSGSCLSHSVVTKHTAVQELAPLALAALLLMLKVRCLSASPLQSVQ